MHKTLSSYNRKWFVIVIVIFTVMVLGVFVMIVSWVADRSSLMIDEKIKSSELERAAIIQGAVAMKYDKIVNSDGLWSDLLVCSGGIIMNKEDIKPVCTGTWVAWQDGVDDACDNDDKTPYFATKDTLLDAVISEDSKIYDNDADARINSVGFIYPNEKKTIFFTDGEIRDRILTNTGNTAYSLPSDTVNGVLRLTLGGTSGTGVLEVFRGEKENGIFREMDYFRNTVSLNTDGNLDMGGEISTNTPMFFNLQKPENAYFVNISNTSDQVISYDLQMKQNGNPVYIVPLYREIGMPKSTYLFAQGDRKDRNITSIKRFVEGF